MDVKYLILEKTVLRSSCLVFDLNIGWHRAEWVSLIVAGDVISIVMDVTDRGVIDFSDFLPG